MQTVYIWEDLPFLSIPELVLKPLTVPWFGALQFDEENLQLRDGFQLTDKGFRCCGTTKPPPLTPGSLLVTQTFVSF